MARSSNCSAAGSVAQNFLMSRAPHLRVAENLAAVEARQLEVAGGVDSRANRRRRFPRALVGQFLVTHRRHLDLNDDAVEQRPRNLGAVTLNLQGGAGALLGRITMKAAGTPVYRRT
jgi:hypothetical protein